MKIQRLSLIFLVLFSSSLWALKVPTLDGPVVDKAGILSSGEENRLESLILNLEENTSAQLAVLTISSLEGESLETFSLEVAEEWGLGRKDMDNGVLLLVAVDDKGVRLEVGYGLEGSLTDMKSGFIIREQILPSFRSGNYGEGILKGVTSIRGILSGTSDLSAEELARYQRDLSSSQSSSGVGVSINFIIFIIFIILSTIGRRSRFGKKGGSGLAKALLWGTLLSGSTGRSHRGGFGGGSGFSSGGFSGGGGGFGGGGASGGW